MFLLIKTVGSRMSWCDLRDERDLRTLLMAWVVTIIACPTAGVEIYLLLAPFHFGSLWERAIVAAGALTIWFLFIHRLTLKLKPPV